MCVGGGGWLPGLTFYEIAMHVHICKENLYLAGMLNTVDSHCIKVLLMDH